MERHLQEMRENQSKLRESFHESSASMADALNAERADRMALSKQVQDLQKQVNQLTNQVEDGCLFIGTRPTKASEPTD